MGQPYQPPNVLDVRHTSRSRRRSLCNRALAMSLSAVCFPIVVGFAVDYLIHIDWNWALATLFSTSISLVLSIAGLWVSIRAIRAEKTGRSAVAAFLAIVAVPSSLLAGYFFAMVGLAGAMI